MFSEIKLVTAVLFAASFLAILGFGVFAATTKTARAFDVINYCNNVPKPPNCQDSNPCPAGSTSSTCKEAANTTASNADNPLSGPNGVIQTAANIVAMVTGILAVVMIIISGLMFASAGGNQERTSRARSMFMYSVIGLAVVAAAWTIITFVNNNLVNT